jgi:inositol phosphorylceramide mannosyltransferase catalytic subunit
MAIPKLIHQTLKNKSQISPLLQANLQNLRYLNPNWDHRLYDQKDMHKFILNFYGSDMIKSFDRIDPIYGAARADFFRYLLIYEFGGVYLDIKSTCNRKLDEVLSENDCFILSQWRNDDGDYYRGWGRHPEFGVESEYQQWHIIAAPHHPFLKSVISTVKTNVDKYNPVRDGVGMMGVLRLTGPIAYTLAIKPIETFHNHRVVNITDLGFEYSIFDKVPISDISDLYGGNHYSKLNEPIITLSRSRFLIFLLEKLLLKVIRILLPKSLRRVIKRSFRRA